MAVPDDFDPTHALDGWRAPAPPPLDLDLRSLRPTRAPAPADVKKQAWLKQHGFEMHDVQDVEVRERPPAPPPEVAAPVVELRVAPPAPADPQAVIAEVEMPPVAAAAPEPEPPALDLPPPVPVRDARLLAHWQPDAWLGLTRQLSGAAAEVRHTPAGLQVEHRAAQWLCAAWPPQASAATPGRWPAWAALVEGESAADAWTSLLGELPAEAPLWPSPQDADWGLLAELVLHQDAGLQPTQSRLLRELVEAERSARRSHIEQGYTREGRVARQRA